MKIRSEIQSLGTTDENVKVIYYSELSNDETVEVSVNYNTNGDIVSSSFYNRPKDLQTSVEVGEISKIILNVSAEKIKNIFTQRQEIKDKFKDIRMGFNHTLTRERKHLAAELKEQIEEKKETLNRLRREDKIKYLSNEIDELIKERHEYLKYVDEQETELYGMYDKELEEIKNIQIL